MKGLFADINREGDRLEVAEHARDNDRIGLTFIIPSGKLRLTELEWEKLKTRGDAMLAQRKGEDAIRP